MIAAGRLEVRPFSDKQIALLRNFAAQAVIAMENARLITETREALEQQTATAEVLGVINSSPGDLAPVFDAMLEKALHLCDANFGSVYARNGEHFDRVASHGLPTEYLAAVPTVAGPFAPGGVFERIIGGENLISIPDLADPEVIRLTPRFEPLVRLAGAHSYVSAALRKDEMFGMIAIYRREVRPFTDKQIALLQNFAAQAVIAVENARLLGELRQRTDEVAELNRGLEARVAEQVDELGRVGRLKRFLAPQLAELIVSHGDERSSKAIAARSSSCSAICAATPPSPKPEPEEVLKFLREYHGALGPLVSQFEGTLDQFSGDGIMVFFQ
jgi:adenylate cyclase